MSELLPCPFCGGDAEVERIGTARVSMIVACQNCGCRLESNEVPETSLKDVRWNTRTPPKLAAVCETCNGEDWHSPYACVTCNGTGKAKPEGETE